ncbi:MAG: hypothetical protein BMS9Abin26_1730 [Gammaproteobacteria bacterium]|nr:MAG: hypothetical protein BMS9Abin26_1730 [Gammaproteobacteria bacterium]
MSKPVEPDISSKGEQPFLTHLIELRDRLLRVVLVVILIFLGLFYFANDLYTFIAQPMLRHLPQGSTMVAIDVLSPFLTPLKLAIVASVFIAMPYILFQAWAFIAPGLYQKERGMAVPLLVSSVLLFYAGMVFAYYVVFPLVFGFTTGVVPTGVAVTPDISRYLDVVIKLFFAFGISFEVPIAIILLVWSGVMTPEGLAEKRPYIVVGAFVIGMLLTPPDVVSQILLAIPMWILFELGLIFSRYFVRDAADEKETEDDSAEDTIISSEPASAAAMSDYEIPDTPSSVELSTNYDDGDDLSDEELEDEFDRAEAQEQALLDQDDAEDGEDAVDDAESDPDPEKPPAE